MKQFSIEPANIFSLFSRSVVYFNGRKFSFQKISRISRMIPQFTKLNGREKDIFANSRKLISTQTRFLDFLVTFVAY